VLQYRFGDIDKEKASYHPTINRTTASNDIKQRCHPKLVILHTSYPRSPPILNASSFVLFRVGWAEGLLKGKDSFLL
jgi:hypothetical protein